MNKQILLSMLAILMMTVTLMAHAPKKIILSFDRTSSTLTADIFHKVKNIDKHYISNITIYVNDVEVNTTSIEKQENKLSEIFEYQLKNVKEGDVIQLVAKCNKFGKKSAKLIVE